VYLPLEIGTRSRSGREGDLPVGVDLADTGISRQAITITPTPEGWQVVCTNSNRAALTVGPGG